MTGDIRARHTKHDEGMPGDPICLGCYELWPCDAIRMADERDEWAGLCVDLRYERDAANADADRLAEALRDCAHDAHAYGPVADHWLQGPRQKIGDGPCPFDQCQDSICAAALAALAAHDARKP